MTFDFIIIGSGPAGSIVSNKLAKEGFKIALIDRAKNEKSTIINDFFCPYVNKCPSYYSPLYSNQLGGNSELWHSKIYLLSEDELNMNDWNIKYKELKKYSDLLAKTFNIKKKLLTKFKKKKRNTIHRYSLRANFRNMFKYLKINQNQNIKIFKGYSPVKLIFFKNKVAKVIVKNNEKNSKILNLKNSIIFCAGGLGNPHLLLNLLPNKNPLLGKFLSDHSHVNIGKILDKNFERFKQIAKPNIKSNLGIKDEEIALIKKKDNFFSGIQLDYKTDPLRKLRRFFVKIENLKIRKFLSFFSFIILKLNGLYFKIGVLVNRYYKYSFEFFFSQNPNTKNKASLSHKFDEFGLKKIDIKWNIRKKDQKIYNSIIKEFLISEGFLNEQIKDYNFQNNFYKSGVSGLHPSCTTKIGKSSSLGVINSNLKLFDYDNIYVCGSSVFPFNGYTNPTWTIMTLALRLSHKLKKKYKKI